MSSIVSKQVEKNELSLTEKSIAEEICQFDGNRLTLRFDLAGNGEHLLCDKCGVVIEIASFSDESIKFDRGSPSNVVLLGDGLGTNLETRNPNGTSNMYALHGNNGKSVTRITSKKLQVALGMKTWAVLNDNYTREMTLKGMDEHDPRTANVKQMISGLLLSSGSEVGEMTFSSPIVDVSSENMQEPRYVGREGRYLIYESSKGLRIYHDPEPESREIIKPKKDEFPERKCPCYYCENKLILPAPLEELNSSVDIEEQQQIQQIIRYGRVQSSKGATNGKKRLNSDDEQIVKVVTPILREHERIKDDYDHWRIRSDSPKLKHPLLMRPGSPSNNIYGIKMGRQELKHANLQYNRNSVEQVPLVAI